MTASVRTALLSMLVLLLTSCAFTPVAPWDRDLMARPEMQLVPDRLETAADEHIYFSKEAAFGGRGVGGGGCGCN